MTVVVDHQECAPPKTLSFGGLPDSFAPMDKKTLRGSNCCDALGGQGGWELEAKDRARMNEFCREVLLNGRAQEKARRCRYWGANLCAAPVIYRKRSVMM